MSRRVLLSWSSGKDSAWTLHMLRKDSDVEVVGLLTTVNTTHGRVAMHSTRLTIVEAPDLDAALEWGRRLALATTLPIEVRPFAG